MWFDEAKARERETSNKKMKIYTPIIFLVPNYNSDKDFWMYARISEAGCIKFKT